VYEKTIRRKDFLGTMARELQGSSGYCSRCSGIESMPLALFIHHVFFWLKDCYDRKTFRFATALKLMTVETMSIIILETAPTDRVLLITTYSYSC